MPIIKVIIPAYTYAATALAVIHVGATPVMVDVEADFNISIHNMEKAITSKTKAVIPVDIAGWPCDYEAIDALVKNKKDLSNFYPVKQNRKVPEYVSTGKKYERMWEENF